MKNLFACLLCLLPFLLPAQCNGDSALCARRYDEVCYLTTHNAFNYQGAFFFPNQSHPVSQQLQGGVRGLMLDVHWYNGQATVYHSSNFLGNQPLIDLLDDIKAFLDQNPNEVVSIIFECYITAAQMEAVFQQANLLAYAHEQPPAQPWPTLADMIQSGKRLVVFTDASDTQGRPWYHHVWDFAVETHYTAHSRTDFSCDYNRGDSTNSLFILNHFVTDESLGYGLPDSAQAVNANPYLQSRAMGCWSATGKRPNFLTLDFYEMGDGIAVKDAINAGLVSAAAPQQASQIAWRLYPNPSTGLCKLQTPPTRGSYTLSLRDALGREVYHAAGLPMSGSELELDLQHLEAGCYFLHIDTRNGRVALPLVLAE